MFASKGVFMESLIHIRIATLQRISCGVLLGLIVFKLIFFFPTRHRQLSLSHVEELANPAPDRVRLKLAEYYEVKNATDGANDCNSYDNWRHCLEQKIQSFKVFQSAIFSRILEFYSSLPIISTCFPILEAR